MQRLKVATVFDEHTAARCREDFPALRRTLAGQPLAFLDGPAGTQVPEAVIAAISNCYRNHNVNTQGNFPPSAELDQALLEARSAVADLLGAPGPQQVCLGQNMTSLAFALSHAIGRSMHPGDEVLITQLDHEANRGPWQQLREHGAVVREIPLLPAGELDYRAMEAMISPRTRLVAFGCSSNAIGTVNDLHRARRLSRAVGALLILDAVHYAPHFPVDVAALDPDFLLCSAYKFYGPHVGILYARPGALESLATDRLSTQSEAAPYRIETGTLNHPAIEGVRAAIDYLARFGRGTTRSAAVHDAIGALGKYEHDLASQLWSALRAIRGVRLWGPEFTGAPRAPTVSFTIDGVDAAAIARALGAAGICAWDGNFYAPRPVEVLNVPGAALLRVGISMYNLKEEAMRLVGIVGTMARKA